MRLFQNGSVHPSYRGRLRELSDGSEIFADHMAVLTADRYGAVHVLNPVLRLSPNAFFASGDDLEVQRLWARERGMPERATRDDILLAQIEQHRTEVFYNTDPVTFSSAFVKRLPGSVRHSIAWRAAPSGSADFRAYDLMVCNFPGILESYRAAGMRAAYFAPAFDPEMAPYAANLARPIDILFVGGYSRHHQRRASLLLAVAGLSPERKVVMHFDRSRLTAWAESAPGRWLLPARLRRPHALHGLAKAPVFGRALYDVLSKAKIVVNAAIDMAGNDRGNLRCFETMGTGGLLLSDAGRYPEGMTDGVTIATYRDSAELLHKARHLLNEPDRISRIARQGHDALRRIYSKEAQYATFEQLVASIS